MTDIPTVSCVCKIWVVVDVGGIVSELSWPLYPPSRPELGAVEPLAPRLKKIEQSGTNPTPAYKSSETIESNPAFLLKIINNENSLF